MRWLARAREGSVAVRTRNLLWDFLSWKRDRPKEIMDVGRRTGLTQDGKKEMGERRRRKEDASLKWVVFSEFSST